MSVLDTDIIKGCQYAVLENGAADANGTTMLTSMFSLQEIIDSINRVQQQFLSYTGLILTRTALTPDSKSRYDLTPVTLNGPDSIRPRRVTWTEPGATGDTVRVLTQADTWELDQGLAEWGTDTGTPQVWWETTLPQQQVGIAPAPANVGQLGLLYVALAQTLTGAGIALTVPDDWAPYILWGTLAELLSSDGPSYDPLRAQYCSRRLDEGIELAKLILGG